MHADPFCGPGGQENSHDDEGQDEGREDVVLVAEEFFEDFLGDDSNGKEKECSVGWTCQEDVDRGERITGVDDRDDKGKEDPKIGGISSYLHSTLTTYIFIP